MVILSNSIDRQSWWVDVVYYRIIVASGHEPYEPVIFYALQGVSYIWNWNYADPFISLKLKKKYN